MTSSVAEDDAGMTGVVGLLGMSSTSIGASAISCHRRRGSIKIPHPSSRFHRILGGYRMLNIVHFARAWHARPHHRGRRAIPRRHRHRGCLLRQRAPRGCRRISEASGQQAAAGAAAGARPTAAGDKGRRARPRSGCGASCHGGTIGPLCPSLPLGLPPSIPLPLSPFSPSLSLSPPLAPHSATTIAGALPATPSIAGALSPARGSARLARSSRRAPWKSSTQAHKG